MAIGNVIQRGRTAYVYDERGRHIASIGLQGSQPDDGLKGYTSSTVNIQVAMSSTRTTSMGGQSLRGALVKGRCPWLLNFLDVPAAMASPRLRRNRTPAQLAEREGL
jgi:hypothetical protein